MIIESKKFLRVSSSQRRHRLNSDEVDPVKEAVEFRLGQLLEQREDLLTAAILFRVYYRLREHVTNRPNYPPHSMWSEIRAYLDYGTVSRGGEAHHDMRENRREAGE